MININSNKPKILFIHNTAMWYRRPFFKKLSEIYDIKFVFTHIQISKDIYGVEISNKIEGLEGVKYKALKNYLGIAFGVIKEAMNEYNILVGGSWDSVSEIIETIFYFIIAKLKRKPIILWSEEWGWQLKSFKRILATPLIKFIVSSSDAILVPGTKHKEHLISLGGSSEQIFIMPNISNISVTDEDYKKSDKLKERFNTRNKKIILYVGRLVKRKGVDYLIKAFSKLQNEEKDTFLMIIGEGECKNKLKSLSKALDIQDKVYFIGQVKNEKLPAYYLLCDVCVVPSITYGMGDPWVFVLNEAMYFEKPVIATDAVGGAFDMIKDGENGFMVQEKDIDALYNTMKKIFSNPELQEKMGKKSKKTVNKRFRYENMVDGFLNAVNHALNR